MTLLILCVDRDNDLGTKAKIKTPIIGREDNLNAALALGLEDPEDPDTNAMLSAIKVYDDFVKDGKDAKIATICGDANVGIYSDKILVEQFEDVLAKTHCEEIILISDGREDEYILPLLTSRVKIASVRRVIMKQASNIESSYYFIVKALKDEKIQKKFIVPSALFLIVLCVATALGYSDLGFATVGFTIGIYLLISAFNLEATLARIAKDFKEGLMTGRVSLFTSILAILTIIIGLLLTYTETERMGGAVSPKYIFSFIASMIWWTIAASIISIFGRIFDKYAKERKIIWSYWIVPFSLVAFGLIILAASDVVNNIEGGIRVLIAPPLLWYLVAKLGLAIIIGFIGFVTHRYIKTHLEKEEEITVWQY